MKRYSIFHPIVLSFYSKSLYQDVGKQWRGTGLGYLLLLLAVCWAPEMWKMQVGFTKFTRNEGADLVKQIPAITISKGEVTTNVENPYFIKDPKNGTVLAIIDTTGQYTSLGNTPAKMLLTKDQLITKKNDYETQTYDLKNVKSFYFDQHKAQSWLDLARKWLTVVLYPLVLLFSFLYRAVQALLYALIGMIFAKIMKATLGYMALLRLAIIAVTPAVIVDTIHSLGNVHTPYWSLICFLIAMAYLLFAVKANAEPDVATLGQPPPSPGQQSI
jgi:Protein of unknown function (DUF1189)